jgi:hypothetical protein
LATLENIADALEQGNKQVPSSKNNKFNAIAMSLPSRFYLRFNITVLLSNNNGLINGQI